MTASPDRAGSDQHDPATAFDDAPDTALLFEVAWEVCSQVGGIYTVLRSKAPATVRRWGDAYCLIGPYRESSARIELEPQQPDALLAGVLARLAEKGIRAEFGRWLVTGRPRTVLLDVDTVRDKLPQVKYSLWKDNGVASPDGDGEFDDAAAFGCVVTEFLLALEAAVGERPVLAHFHEWQAGAALPMLRHRGARLATVFTTHATLVGRNLSASNAELYEHLRDIDAGGAAYAAGYAHRHALEGAAASAADIFTTVSGITALEAEQFLGRRPDALLPNGLNVERFTAPHEFQVLHRASRDRIHEFVMGHFFPSYTFDLDRTLYVFTSGRYEYRNKGLDVFIEALHELNQRMKADGATATVVAFIVTRAATRAFNVETLNRQAMLDELRDTCAEIEREIGQRLFHTIARSRMPTIEDLLDEYGAVRLKRMMYALRRSSAPTIVTHDLVDDAGDPILGHLRYRGLWNMPEDRVKVVYHPDFMSVTSPLLGMDYDRFVRGCHLGVFPSYYEPWGYTPLECLVRGVPAITSDLSGFGAYVMENFPGHDERGLYVARRRGVSFAATVEQVTAWLYNLTRMSRRERIALRNQVESHAEHFDWNNLGRYYAAARRLAFLARYPGREHVPEVSPSAIASALEPTRRAPRRTRRQ
ncbi:MAG: glycosyltransferase [Phycisphaerae bacterium]|jgi:glycogen(starch) synthase